MIVLKLQVPFWRTNFKLYQIGILRRSVYNNIKLIIIRLTLIFTNIFKEKIMVPLFGKIWSPAMSNISPFHFGKTCFYFDVFMIKEKYFLCLIKNILTVLVLLLGGDYILMKFYGKTFA